MAGMKGRGHSEYTLDLPSHLPTSIVLVVTHSLYVSLSLRHEQVT